MTVSDGMPISKRLEYPVIKPKWLYIFVALRNLFRVHIYYCHSNIGSIMQMILEEPKIVLKRILAAESIIHTHSAIFTMASSVTTWRGAMENVI